MLFSLVATLVSLIWLLHRATRLLQIPIPTLIQLLGIDIPAPPHVCLDSVTTDSITLHWSLPDRATSVAKHVIQMDGQNVGESEKRETTVTITGLNPDQVYGVRVLAVNSNHYSAAGPLIRLRTRRKSEDLILTNIQPISRETSDDSDSHGRKSSLVYTQFKRGNRHARNSSPTRRDRSDSSSFTAATQPYTIESLAAELEQIRSEISEIVTTHAHAEEEYAAAEAALQSELESLRDKRKEEDGVRAHLRSETKSLEESKRMLEAQKSKVERAAKHKAEVIEKIVSGFAKWDDEKKAADARIAEIAVLTVQLHENFKVREAHSRTALQQGHKQIAELEDEVRGLISKIKKAETEKDPHLGNASENAFMKLLHSEDAEDMRLERAWQETQKLLELRYVNVFEQYRDADEKFRKAQDALTGMAMQGSISPAEASKSVKRRNRARNKARQNVSSPITSYPLHDSRFPDASTFNNLQFPSLHSNFLQFNASSTSGSLVMNNNSSSSLPLNPFSNTPSMVNLFPEPLDVSTPEELLASGGPISPSVDMLLPSNLFMTDDVPQELSNLDDDDQISSPRTRTKTSQSELSLDSGSLFPSFNQPLLSSPSPAPPSPSSLSFSRQPVSRPYSPMQLAATSTPQSSFNFPPYFTVGSGLKNLSPPPSLNESPATDSISLAHSDTSGGGGKMHDLLMNPSVGTPGGSNLISVFNASNDDTEELRQRTTNSSTSSTLSSTKRSPSRRLMFGGVSGLPSIGSIGKKKESLDNGTGPNASLASEGDDFLLLNPDEPRTPGRRFVNLFSFSSKRASNAGLAVPPSDTVQAPIGTRRRSGSFNSANLESPAAPAPASPTRIPSSSNAFSTGMGNLFGSPVFGRRNGLFPWDLKTDNNNNNNNNNSSGW